MIPLRLQLKNFLSYGSDIQTIDFSTYPLICLSGKNGHGKSALLDAITWAVWGHARKTSGQSKADQGLLRLGQTQMMVAIDFEFNNTIYRVRREFALTYGKPYAALDFGMIDASGTFIPLTDKTISLTQAKIENTLNLSFESFVNSAFLRQGHSNEFSKKSPKERKEILAAILGLNHYETVRKLALEKIRSAQAEKMSRHAVQEKIEQELTLLQELPAQAAEVHGELEQLNKNEHDLVEHQKNIHQAMQALQADQKACEILLVKKEQLEKSKTELENTLIKSRLEWRTVHKQQLQAPDVGSLETKKADLVQAVTVHQTQLQKSLELKEAILKLKEQIQTIAQALQEQNNKTLNTHAINLERLRLEKTNKEREINEIKKQHETLILEKNNGTQQIIKIRDLIVQNNPVIENLSKLEKQFERRKEYYQKFNEQGRWLTAELENIEQKKELTHNENDPSCPLCEQTLSAARKRFLKEKFAEQEKFHAHRLRRIAKVVKQLKEVLLQQHTELESSKKIVEQTTMLKHTLAELEKQRVACDEKIVLAQKNEQELQLSFNALTESITKQDSIFAQLKEQEISQWTQDARYQKATTELKCLTEQLASINYNHIEHQRIIGELQIIEKHLTDIQSLQIQLGQQEQRKNYILDICQKLKEIKKERNEIDTQIHHYATLKVRAESLAQAQQRLDQEIKIFNTKRDVLIQKKATIEAQKNTLQKLELEHKHEQKLIIELENTIYDYQAIASAISKDGIQALLIEEAIPEIEQEANALLSKLTNNQAHIFIESLRDLKKGGTKETLDIKISDAAGIRPYELFSGGEAFRIDFALRIAISKLLARRAGTSLQTLIIDEGFGSQDEDGLTLIMDSLYKIQDDFAKIIIVSHLPSMKDQFPVHFVIDKGPNGSHVSVLEQG